MKLDTKNPQTSAGARQGNLKIPIENQRQAWQDWGMENKVAFKQLIVP